MPKTSGPHTKTMVCHKCATGTMRPTNLRGRSLSYRDQSALTFDENLTVPVCDRCGDMRLRRSEVAKFSAVLERLRDARKREAVADFVTVIGAQFGDVPRYAWEDALGLSHGYLSRLESGTRTPDTPLEILMRWVALDSAGALRVLANLGHLPAQLRDRLAPEGARRKTRG